MKKNLLVMILFILLQKSLMAGDIKVIDGDTIRWNDLKIRFSGIDAPERKQICSIKNQSYNCGLKSAKFLQSFITGRKVECSYKNLDKS